MFFPVFFSACVTTETLVFVPGQDDKDWVSLHPPIQILFGYNQPTVCPIGTRVSPPPAVTEDPQYDANLSPPSSEFHFSLLCLDFYVARGLLYAFHIIYI
jgi:hypothetical protein